MGAIFGRAHFDGRPVAAGRWQHAAAMAAAYGRDGVHSWQGDGVALGRALNLVRVRATPEARRLPAELACLHGVASARLDNRDALLADFRLPAEASDLTLILLAYARWGVHCPEHLDGDFALAIWDQRTRSLFCARDRAGLRPLFFRQSGEGFAFASALPLLAAVDGAGRELDAEALAAYWMRRPVDAAASHWRGVERLPPASSLLLQDGRIRLSRYWQPRAADPGCRSEADWAAAARTILADAVAKQTADTPLRGLMLSGGLDSSFLLGLAVAQQGVDTLRAAASVLPRGHRGPEIDERAQLTLLQQHFPGLQIEEVIGSIDDPLAGDTWEPIWSLLGRPANLFHGMDRQLLGALAAQGARVVLSGFWGDGTLSYRGPGWAGRLLRSGRWYRMARTAGVLARRDGHSVARECWRELRALLPARPRPFAAEGAEKLLAPHLRQSLRPRSAAGASGAPWQWLPEVLTTGFQALEEQTLAAAACGSELACPFLAPALVELILAAPPEIHVADDRRRGFARTAMQELVPEAIRLRTDKQAYFPGFSAAARQAWPAYRESLRTAIADPALRAHLSSYLDLAELQRVIDAPPPSGSGFGRERGMLQRMQALATFRFLRWAHAGRELPV